jgi:hypothetical protein
MVSAIAMQVSKDLIWGKVENALPRIQSNGKSEAKCKLKILDNLLSYAKKMCSKRTLYLKNFKRWRRQKLENS